jgi:hypothetical protein
MMTPEEKIERVAKAIARSVTCDKWEHIDAADRKRFMTFAGAAFGEMRWGVKIDEMLAAMSRAAHLANDSNADLIPGYRKEIDTVQAIRSELLDALSA